MNTLGSILEEFDFPDFYRAKLEFGDLTIRGTKIEQGSNATLRMKLSFFARTLRRHFYCT